MDAITDAITQTQRNWVFALRQIYATQRKSPIALRLRWQAWAMPACDMNPAIKNAGSKCDFNIQ